MIGSKKVISVIPARGGSKRLPGKNVLKLNGTPLIVYSIQSALSCHLIDKVIVSTDSRIIADAAKDAGAEVDMRSEELSTDAATTIDVLKDLLVRLDSYEICVTLQPTSPLRTVDDITESLDFLLCHQRFAEEM